MADVVPLKLDTATSLPAQMVAGDTIPYGNLSGTPTSLPPSGAAGGDLTGTYPNPTLRVPSGGLSIPQAWVLT